MEFDTDISMIISQLEIYDQIWYGRYVPENRKHSREAIGLAEKIIARLELIPDGGAECFPFELIDRLREEYEMD